MTLAECDDTLSPQDLVAVIGISISQYYLLRKHGAFPIQQIAGLGQRIVRYSKASVQEFLSKQATQSQRSRRHSSMHVVRRKVS